MLKKVRIEVGARIILGAILLASVNGSAEDGYRLWLRYEPLPKEAAERYLRKVTSVVVPGQSGTLEAVRKELRDGVSGLLGVKEPLATAIKGDGAVLVGTPKTSPQIAQLGLPLEALGNEGYCLRCVQIQGRAATVVAANTDLGALYGAFHLLRLLQTGVSLEALQVDEKPRLQVRMLNHWYYLGGGIDWDADGYALWDWNRLPDKVDARLRDYARANASIGINGTVLNNVNADAKILTSDYLSKVAAIADAFRPYGVKVFLSARFSAPIDIGGLKTADPLDTQVAKWWRTKADEIYARIPDFGGFLVKANSEGQPGPRTYHRSHAEGANMLAAALAPHQGIVIWRAFVYDYKREYDRAAAAYDEFRPLDGRFASNVLVQVKNGPVDFQPREPFHPLFGAMPKTQLIPELQILQEYMGRSTHLVYLAPMWREFLLADTDGQDTTVANVCEASAISGIAGVSNVSSVRSWTGHPFSQANWYAFGRLSWNPETTSEDIAREWIRMTLTRESAAVDTIARIMLESHEAAVDYMMPLGLHHIAGNHYDPGPWRVGDSRPDWWATYYHKADEKGIGFDRTMTGSKAVACYQPKVRDRFADIATCPENLLLWFHHVPWDQRLISGRTLWEEMALHYQRGVDWVRNTRKQWSTLQGVVDRERYALVAKKLAMQEDHAQFWKNACLLYFQVYSTRPLPKDVEKPDLTLQEYIGKIKVPGTTVDPRCQ